VVLKTKEGEVMRSRGQRRKWGPTSKIGTAKLVFCTGREGSWGGEKKFKASRRVDPVAREGGQRPARRNSGEGKKGRKGGQMEPGKLGRRGAERQRLHPN